MIKYTLKDDEILKDGHTMFKEDIVKNLNRLSYLEKERKKFIIEMNNIDFKEFKKITLSELEKSNSLYEFNANLDKFLRKGKDLYMGINYENMSECEVCGYNHKNDIGFGKSAHAINLALNYNKILGEIRARQINRSGWFNVTPDEANNICSKK